MRSCATERGGAARLCWAETRLRRSEMCWSVGARVAAASCSGRRLPGGSTSIPPVSASSSHTPKTRDRRTSALGQAHDAALPRDLLAPDRVARRVERRDRAHALALLPADADCPAREALGAEDLRVLGPVALVGQHAPALARGAARRVARCAAGAASVGAVVFARCERDGLLGGVEEGDDERVVELDCDGS
jgi:hypothetical protein